jgi:cytochrome c oxidase accessory protein FixG
MAIKKTDTSDFRDKISTVDKTGKRKWIYALQPQGKLYQWRTISSVIYLVLFFSLPFIKVNGNPLFQFNILEARFILFGKIFLPQDFILFGIAMLVFLVFIIVFTLVFGRVFCGWACPQTIFMEMVFRKIEYWIEGPANRQEVNDSKAWTTELYLRKTAKHLVFFAISFLIANTFLSYIIGVDTLFKTILEPMSEHIMLFAGVVVFTFLFYGVFAFMREIACTVVCPYGRLQSVLLDKNSIVVAYDYVRGEPRNKSTKNNEGNGDCIDCGLCVHVCPTGIDIRNGTQLECTNCTACIDACNMMMEKVHRPFNLIKYASENNIEQNKKPEFSYRIKGYSAVLAALLIIFFSLIITRSMFDATILRVPGQLMQENNDGTISNLYRIKIVNKSNNTAPYQLFIDNPDATIQYAGKQLDSLKPGIESEQTFFIKIPKEKVTERKQDLKVFIKSGEEVVQTKKISFIGAL